MNNLLFWPHVAWNDMIYNNKGWIVILAGHGKKWKNNNSRCDSSWASSHKPQVYTCICIPQWQSCKLNLPSLYYRTSYVCHSKGSCQVKKIQKSEKNSDWPDPTHPPPYQFFFWNMKTTQKTQKTPQNFPQKIIIRVGAWPTHPLSSFSRIFWFF